MLSHRIDLLFPDLHAFDSGKRVPGTFSSRRSHSRSNKLGFRSWHLFLARPRCLLNLMAELPALAGFRQFKCHLPSPLATLPSNLPLGC